MPDEETPVAKSVPGPAGSAESPAQVAPVPKSVPWVTALISLICVGVFLSLAFQKDSPELLAKYGILPPEAIWDGAYWGLITSAFVHQNWWHVGLNLFWFWLFGTRIERAIGSWWFLVLIVSSAFVASALELGISSQSGMGASGVVYALFGFMWVARQRYPQFQDVLNRKTIQLFIVWLFVCVVLTVTNTLNMGNAAHFGGLLFGIAVAACCVANYSRPLAAAAVTVLVGFSMVSLVWCPWSIHWLRYQAFKVHEADQFDRAIELYTRIIERDPGNPWAYANRGSAYAALGELEKSDADLERAQQLESSEKK